jgi:hypothetical protein
VVAGWIKPRGDIHSIPNLGQGLVFDSDSIEITASHPEILLY